MVFSVHNYGFYGVPNTFCQEKHQHFHVNRQLVTKKEISIKINSKYDTYCSWPSGLTSGVVKGARMGKILASDWSSDVITGSGMGHR